MDPTRSTTMPGRTPTCRLDAALVEDGVGPLPVSEPVELGMLMVEDALNVFSLLTVAVRPVALTHMEPTVVLAPLTNLTAAH